MKIIENTILITGGTSGIGREMVSQFYALRNKLIVVSSNMDKLHNLQIDFPDIDIIVCDLSDNLAVKQLIKTCIEKHPNINILINNAGVQYNYLWTKDLEYSTQIEKEIAINFTSPMQLTHGLLPILLNKKESAVINISSALAYTPKKSAVVYCATKAAIHNATKALRYQLENTNVKVFEIIPPLVNTNMTKASVKRKISPEKLVYTCIKNLKNNRYESKVGKAKLLYVLQRISPKIASYILKNN
ncbi:SDR family oxidoreductase [Formosa sp. A9]|uniref:SDR family oxidoreductase n=1 Tax=Formosa sp. A9 TaxID=3442641 RepID=UPI003EB6DC37